MNDVAKSLSTVRIPDLQGLHVLVTGASTGIGAAVARALGQQGAHVAIHYNSSEAQAHALASEIERNGVKAPLIQGDMGQPGAGERVVEEAARQLGRLDGLINNAGGMLGRVSFADMTDDLYERVMDLNARSVLAATRAAAPFLQQSEGFVINTTSIAARHGGGPGSTLYAASKGFVSTITKGHAKELAGLGIRVNAVSPGTILTPFHERYSNAEQLETTRKGVPLGRLGAAEDCVGTYLFLASKTLSGYLTGQIIEVNGGLLMP